MRLSFGGSPWEKKMAVENKTMRILHFVLTSDWNRNIVMFVIYRVYQLLQCAWKFLQHLLILSQQCHKPYIHDFYSQWTTSCNRKWWRQNEKGKRYTLCTKIHTKWGKYIHYFAIYFISGEAMWNIKFSIDYGPT